MWQKHFAFLHMSSAHYHIYATCYKLHDRYKLLESVQIGYVAMYNVHNNNNDEKEKVNPFEMQMQVELNFCNVHKMQ